jgi:hypothetical protein
VDTFLKTRSGFYLNPITEAGSLDPQFGGSRPNVISGQPFWVDDPNVPEGRRLNPAAFEVPQPGIQGNLGRNAIESFGLFQWDFSVRRTFSLSEDLNFQFKADFFNFLNHPNFADPVTNMSSGLFGQSINMLNTGLSPGVPSSGFSSFYQIGGPRSVQFALKLMF